MSHVPKPFVGVESPAVVLTSSVVVVRLELASDCLDQVVKFRIDWDVAVRVFLQNHLSRS